MKKLYVKLIVCACILLISGGLKAQTLKGIGKKIGKKVESVINNTIEEGEKTSSSSTGPTKTSNPSKYGPFEDLQGMKDDFQRGTERVFYDDFSKDAVGEMAQRWTSNGRGEVNTVEGIEGQWLQLFDGNTYKIKELIRIPEDFTLEFDVLSFSEHKHEFALDFGFDYEKGVGKHYYVAEENPVNIRASYRFNYFQFNSKETSPKKESMVKANMSTFVNDIMKVKIRVEGRRMRTYINDYKILDTEMTDPSIKKYFYLALNSDDKSGSVYVSNFRIDKI